MSARLAVFWNHIAVAAKQRAISLSEAIRSAGAMGYGLAEMDYSDLERDPSIADRLSDEGMGVSSIYRFFDFGRDGDAAPGDALIDMALRCGSKRIMLIPGFYSDMADPSRCERERDLMCRAMSDVCEAAGREGLATTIEDFDQEDSPIRDSAGMLWFLERIPKLGATYDTGNFRFCGEDEIAALKRLAPRIAHVHLKDRLLTPVGAVPKRAMDGAALYPSPVGEGIVPMAEILRRLREDGYAGVYSVEHFDAPDQLAYMEASANFVLRRVMAADEPAPCSGQAGAARRD